MNKRLIPLSAFLSVFILVTGLFLSPFAFTLPTGGQVTSGSADLRLQNANSLVIDQHTNRVSINFSNFNIGADEIVQFNQPGRESIALNRVSGGQASQIMGQLQANGQVFLINPQGIIFGQQARVNVGGLIASTLNISDADFINGRWNFTNESAGAINNFGALESSAGGYIALLAPDIHNAGELTSPAGSVFLHAADSVVMDFSGHQLLAIETDRASYDAAIRNSGTLTAIGGQVLLTANATNELLATAIDNSGIIEATGFQMQHGVVVLSAEGTGAVINSGLITAEQLGTSGDGGVIELTGSRVAQLGELTVNGLGEGDGGVIHINAADVIALGEDSRLSANGGDRGNGGEIVAFSPDSVLFRDGAEIYAKGGALQGDGGFVELSGWQHVEILGAVDTSAANGQSGEFLIDPYNITILNAGTANGSFTGGVFTPSATGAIVDVAVLQTNLQSGNVTILTTGAGAELGDINVAVDVDLDGTNGNTLTLQADGSIFVNGNIRDSVAVTIDGTDIVFIAGDGISITDGFEVNASIGTIDFTAGGIANITGLSSLNSAADAVKITAASITDAGNTSLDIYAISGGMQLNTTAGISGLETLALTAAISNSTSGNVDIMNIGNIELTSINAADAVTILAPSGDILVSGFTTSGALTLTANQNLTINDGVLVDTGSAAITLSATNGNATITGLSTTSISASAINVSAGDQILDGGNSNTDIVNLAGGTALTAENGINDLEVQLSALTLANNTSGNVTLHQQLTGAIDIQSLNTVADFSLDSSGVIQLSDGAHSIGGDLLLDAGSANIILPDAGLVATGNITLNAADVIDSDDTIAIAGANLFLNLSAPAASRTYLTTIDSLNFTNAGSQAVVFNESDSVTLESIVMANGNTTINTATGDITLGSAGASLNGNGGTLRLNANGNLNITSNINNLTGLTNIELFATNGTLDIATGINVSSGGGDITMVASNTGQAVTVQAGASVNAGAGKININGDSVIVTGLSSTNTADDAIQIISNTDIQGQAGTDATATLGGIVLAANTGIASFDINAERVSVSNLVSGNVDITSIGNIELTSINAADAVTILAPSGDILVSSFTTSGALTLTANQNLTINDGVLVDTGSTAITLTATNGNATITGLSTTSISASAINVSAGDQILDGGNSNTDIVNLAGGTTLTAENGINDLEVQLSALTLANNTSGNVTLHQQLASIIDIQSLNAAADFSLDSSGAIQLSDGAHSIGGNLLLDAGTANIILPDAGLMATGNIILSAADVIDSDDTIAIAGANLSLNLSAPAASRTYLTTIDSLNFTNAGSQSAVFNETNGITLNDINSGGDFSLLSLGSGDVAVSSITTTQNFLITTSGDIRFNTNSSFSALANMSLNAASIFDDAGGSSFSLTAGGTLTLPDNFTITTTALNLDGNDIIDVSGTRTLNITTSSLTLQSELAGGNTQLNTNVDVLNINNRGGNALVINESDSVTLESIAMASGNTTINTTTGDITLGSAGASLSGNGGTLRLNANGNLNITSDINNLTGLTNIELFATNGTLDIATGINLSSGGGNITMVAANTGQAVSVQTGASVNAGGGKININGDSVIVTGLSSTNTADDAIQITSNTDIQGQAGTDATATLGGIVLAANTGIASFDINVERVSVSNLVSGNVTLHQQLASIIDIKSLNTAADFSLDSSGVIQLSDGAHSIGGDLLLDAGSANIILPDAGLVATGNITLNAADVIDSDDTISIAGANLFLNLSAPAASRTYLTTIDSLNFTNAGSQTVVFNESDSVTLESIVMANGNTTINTATGDITLGSAGASLNGNGGTLRLNANGNLNITSDINNLTGLTNIELFATNGTLDIATGINVSSGGGDITMVASNTGQAVTVQAGASVNAGAGKININGDSVIVTGLSSTNTADDAIQIISNTDIQGQAGTDATATLGGIVLAANTGIASFDIDTERVAVSNLISGNVDLELFSNTDFIGIDVVNNFTLVANSSENITLSNVSNVGGDIEIATAGILQLPDAGLSTSGNIALLAGDIIDTDRTLFISAQDLRFSSGSSGGESRLNLNVNRLDAELTGDGNLIIEANNGLNIVDLNNSGTGLKVTNGNLQVQLLTGDLDINGNISAADTLADGTRSGLIDLSVMAGDLSVGSTGEVNITSSNLVDQTAGEGLTGSASEAAIWLHLTDATDSSRVLSLGNGVGNDVSIIADGGDIIIDALGEANISAANSRSLIVEADVTIEARNNFTDTLTGTVSNKGALVQGIVQARAGRSISLVASEEVTPQEIVTPPAALPPIGEDVAEDIIDTLQDNNSMMSDDIVTSGQQGTDADKLFSSVFDQCTANTSDKKDNCAVQKALRQFLGSLLIGGELPNQ